MEKILFNSDDFFETIGSDYEGIEALYNYASKEIEEGKDIIFEDIDNEKLYASKKENKIVFILEASPFLYIYWGRDSANFPIITYKTMTIKGKTYREKAANLEEMAKDWQRDFEHFRYSWGELAEIGEFFRENGKRYGLIKEFRNNCII